MSDHEQIAQVAHKKWANEPIAHFLKQIPHQLIFSQKTSDWLRKLMSKFPTLLNLLEFKSSVKVRFSRDWPHLLDQDQTWNKLQLVIFIQWSEFYKYLDRALKVWRFAVKSQNVQNDQLWELGGGTYLENWDDCIKWTSYTCTVVHYMLDLDLKNMGSIAWKPDLDRTLKV